MTSQIISEFATIEEILAFAMKEERDAYDFYMAAADRMADPDLKEFLYLSHHHKLPELLELSMGNKMVNDPYVLLQERLPDKNLPRPPKKEST